MITRIEIDNINTTSNVDLSLSKAKYKYLEEYVLVGKVSNPIAIYGKNGSGKSSFLSAIDSLVKLLNGSQDQLRPFQFNYANLKKKKNDLETATAAYIKLYFDIEADEFEYYVSTNYDSITEEYLSLNGVEIFHRDVAEYTFEGLSCANSKSFYPVLRKLANDESNFDGAVSRAYRYLAGIASVAADRTGYTARVLNNMNSLDVMVEKSGEVKKTLSEYKAFPLYDISSYVEENGEKKYRVSVQTENGKTVVIPFNMASTGMKNQSFLLSVLLSLPEGGVMVIDEIEAGLHPLTIMDFIRAANKKKIQLIFSSHNTSVLSKLRPDNIVFTHWKNGYSSYRRLSDIYPNIREVNNIEKMYLSATFDEAIEG